jgi:hypothetical protein
LIGTDKIGISASGMHVIDDFHADGPNAAHAVDSDPSYLAQDDGQYEVRYWWQEATYDQELTICHRQGHPSWDTTTGASATWTGWATGDAAGDNACTGAAPVDVVTQNVYVIPAHFWGNNGPGIFEPLTSPISGNPLLVAGNEFTITIIAKDEFSANLNAPVDALSPDGTSRIDVIYAPDGGELFEFHSALAGSWTVTSAGDGVYTATTTFTQSQCDACDDYLVHVLGMEMSGLGNIAMLGSPFSLEVRPLTSPQATVLVTAATSRITECHRSSRATR